MTYNVRAKEDLFLYPHTWTKGLEYKVITKDDYFTLVSNEGSVNYFNDVKENVFEEFELLD